MGQASQRDPGPKLGRCARGSHKASRVHRQRRRRRHRHQHAGAAAADVARALVALRILQPREGTRPHH